MKISWIEGLSIVFAGLSVLFAIFAFVVALKTLSYVRGRDLEVDNRNGWIEVHRAMVDVRTRRDFVLKQRSQMGAYSTAAPNPYVEHLGDYIVAFNQLRGQLDRLNDDPLKVDLTSFLARGFDNWQTQGYEDEFDKFADKVAVKSRPN